MFYHKVIDPQTIKNGIKELRYIDRKIKKIREIKKKDGKMKMNLTMRWNYKEYYVYNEKGVGGSMNTGGIRIHPDAISFCTIRIKQKNVILSHLHGYKFC